MKFILQYLCVACLLSSQAFCAVISTSWATQDQGAAQNWVTTLPPREEELNSTILDGETLVSFNPNDSPGYQDFLGLIQDMMDMTPMSSDFGRSASSLYELAPSIDAKESSPRTFNAEIVFGHGTSVPEPSSLMLMSLFGFGLLLRRKTGVIFS